MSHSLSRRRVPPRHRRKWPWALGGVAGLVTLGVALSPDAPPPAPSAATSSIATSSTSAMAATPAGDTVAVARVVDGDTFDTAVGRQIRVLGIDSCESGTIGGAAATAAAKAQLVGRSVTLTAEPGVDLDRFDRQLRYVQVDGRDFGEAMVKHAHTGIYQGRNDASPTYLQRLRAIDDGRDCSGPTTTSPPVAKPSVTAKPRVATAAPAPVAAATDESPSVYFGSCKAAKAAGTAPLHRGEPGYRSALDGDSDGVACER